MPIKQCQSNYPNCQETAQFQYILKLGAVKLLLNEITAHLLIGLIFLIKGLKFLSQNSLGYFLNYYVEAVGGISLMYVIF